MQDHWTGGSDRHSTKELNIMGESEPGGLICSRSRGYKHIVTTAPPRAHKQNVDDSFAQPKNQRTKPPRGVEERRSRVLDYERVQLRAGGSEDHWSRADIMAAEIERRRSAVGDPLSRFNSEGNFLSQVCDLAKVGQSSGLTEN